MSCKKCNTEKCNCTAEFCINPLIHMFKGANALVGTSSAYTTPWEILGTITGLPIPLPTPENKNTYDITTALIQTLSSGISISNNSDFCCPDCKNGVYYLGNVQSLSIIIGTTQRVCCIEHYAALPLWSAIVNKIGTYQCCDTDFSEMLGEWIANASANSDYFDMDMVLAEGLAEISSFNNYSGLGILYNFLKLTYPELTPEDYLNILAIIINLGIVVECNGCEMIIASTETYITYKVGGKAFPADQIKN